VAAARKIYDRIILEKKIPAPDWEVILFAALLHDTGYREDHKKLGFAHKEAYSAHLAEKLLRSLERSLAPLMFICVRISD